MPTVVAADGVRIAAYHLGGEGPDLVLAHATGFHARTWIPMAAILASRYSCTAFDERGHGDSGVPEDGDFDWHRFADDALAVVDGIGLDRPLGVGHSCGGALLLLAEQARPGTFRALYCFEPIVVPLDEPPPPPSDHPLAAQARRRREVFPSRSAAYDHFAGHTALATLDPAALQAYVDFGFEDLDDGTVRLKCRGETEARVYENGLSHDAYRHLGLVRCPVTLACGEQSRTMGRAVLERHAARLPRARVEVVAGVGHLGPMEDPAAVAEAVLDAFADA